MMKPLHILLDEDNEGDILLTREAFEKAKIPIILSMGKDEKEAIDFLIKAGNHQGANLPDMRIPYVNMPKKNGHKVLQFIQGNENLHHIPVIMFITASSQKHINLPYRQYDNYYITKPPEVDDFIGVAATIENFWVFIARLTNKRNNYNDKR
ncbi:MAG: response regulator [Ginsengibacter sp.]